MNRNSTIRRAVVARKVTAHRWDRAYLHLLRWAAQARQESQLEGPRFQLVLCVFHACDRSILEPTG